MSNRDPHARAPAPRPGRPARAFGWGLCFLAGGSAIGQAAAGEEAPKDENQAAFRWQVAKAEKPQAPPAPEHGWVLDLGSEIAPAAAVAAPTGELTADAWGLSRLLPNDPEPLGETLDTGFAFRSIAAAPVTAGRADRWARSVFSQEASMLTPLAGGHEVVGWELLDGLTLSGVGSRRVVTDRDRGFVISAEAGIRLTPKAGFQLGYELLRASAGAVTEDLGGDAIFARFQLRF